MAAPQTSNRREPIEFPQNAPVRVALKDSEPRRITELGITVREPFTITRKQSGENSGLPLWEIARIPGGQPDRTFVVTKMPYGTTIPQ